MNISKKVIDHLKQCNFDLDINERLEKLSEEVRELKNELDAEVVKKAPALEEIADVIICCVGLLHAWDEDLETVLDDKMAKNVVKYVKKEDIIWK